MACLRIVQNGKEYRRNLGECLVIGRDAECDLRLNDPRISRLHCVIERSGHGWVAVDLDSHNGTLVSGWPLTRQVLKHGDVLEMGAASLQFLVDENARIEAEANQLLDETKTSDEALESSTPPQGSGNVRERRLAMGRRRSLWEGAMRSAAQTSRPARRKDHAKRQRKLHDELKRVLHTEGAAPTARLAPTGSPWFHRTIPISVAIPGSLGVLLLIYFLANGFPTVSLSSPPPPPKSVPHSSPFNND